MATIQPNIPVSKRLMFALLDSIYILFYSYWIENCRFCTSHVEWLICSFSLKSLNRQLTVSKNNNLLTTYATHLKHKNSIKKFVSSFCGMVCFGVKCYASNIKTTSTCSDSKLLLFEIN